jgi:ribosomal protein L4
MRLRLGTANEAALEQTIKIALEEIDKLINLETPKQTKEIANAIESVVMEVTSKNTLAMCHNY